MRLPFFGDGRKQPGPAHQGTVASPAQGTLNGPKQMPVRTETGGTQEIPNTQHTLSQLRGWPANPTRMVMSAPGSRESQARTDMDLQMQPAPSRVPRIFRDRNLGVIGDNGVASFPYNAEWGYLPHQYIPRRPQAAGPYLRMTDDTAPIQAVYAGNPRPAPR